MKMGTILSPWRYEAARHRALALADTREPTITHCAGTETENMNRSRVGKVHGFGVDDLPAARGGRNREQDRDASQAVP